MRIVKTAVFLFFILAISCKEPFSPDVDPYNKNLLVVEGFLNIGGITTIKLNRSADLQDTRLRIPEVNARLEVEGNDGSLIQGISGQNGECILLTQDMNLAKKYRLKITTANGRIYQTDYLESKATPEIDSVNFRIENDGFQIYANTHDASNQTRFYFWDYNETWEISTPFPSEWEYKSGKIVERDPSVNIQRCWAGASSTEILLGTTERLSENKLSLAPLTHVKGNSIKLVQLYSILVRQYGLTRDAYQYLETMKKNTEQIGTIFDPQPSELKGNLVCLTDPNEKVIGWISAGTISEKRIFISRDDKPAGWAYRENCETFTVHTDSILRYVTGNYMIYRREYFPHPPPNYAVPAPWKYGDIIFVVAPKECIDCRLRGSNVKPSYWPN